MGTSVENRVARMDLDASGFIRNAQAALKHLEELDSAFEMKGAEKAAQTISDVMDDMRQAIGTGAQAAALEMAVVGEAAEKAASSSGDAFDRMSEQIATDFSGAQSAAETFAAQISSAMQDIAESTDGVAAAMNTVYASASEASTSIGAAMSQADAAAQHAGADISDSAQRSAENAENAFANLGSNAEKIGQQTAAGAKTGFAAAEASAAATATSIAIKLGLITAAVGAAAIGIHALVKTKGGDIRQSVHDVCEGVRQKIVAAKDRIHTVVTFGLASLKNAFSEGNLGFIKEKLQEAFEKGKEAVAKVLTSLKQTLERYFPETTAIIEGALSELKDKFETRLDEIKTSVRSRVNDIREEFEFLKNGLSGVVDDGVGAVKDKAGSLKERIAGAFPWKKDQNETGPASSIAYGNDLEHVAQKARELAEAEKKAAQEAKELSEATETASDALQSEADAMQNSADASVEQAEASENTADEIKKLAEETDDADEALEDFGESVEETVEQTADAAEAAEDAAKETKDYGKEAKEAGKKTEDAAKKGASSVKGLSGLFQALKSDVGGLKDAADEAAASGSVFGAIASAALVAGPVLIKKYRESLQEQTEDTDKLRDAVAAFGDKAAGVYDKLTGMISTVSNSVSGLINKVEQFGEKVAKEFTVDQIKAGWSEYELKMGSVQTIMAGTGASLEEVNRRLDELNEYADRTIYSFSDMTNNIGKFTNQGVKLEDAVAAIKGISNEAALSGANAQQASNAMYNFAQALSTGYIQNIDWKSIENAMMATTGFKEELIKTAKELGTLKEAEKAAGDQTTKYVSTTTDNTGHISDAFDAMSGFRDSLKAQWLTNNVLIETLKKYTDETTELGKAAYHAAQDVKTGSQLMDTLKEAIGSGWAKTFELIVGDFEAAKKFWTGINDLISPVIDAISDWRNTLIGEWAKIGGRQNLIEGIKTAFEGLRNTVKTVIDALGEAFQKISAEKIRKITDRVAEFAAKLAPTEAQLTRIKDIFVKLFDGARSVWTAVTKVTEQVKTFIEQTGALSGLGDVFGFITGSGEQATGALDRLLATVEGIVERVRTFLQEGIAETIKKHASDIKSLVEGVTSVLSAAKSVAEKFFSMRFDSLTSVIKAVLDAALNVVGVIGKVTKAIGDFVKKNDKLVATVIKIVTWGLKTKAVLTIMVPLISGLATKIGALVGTVTMVVKLAKSAKTILPLLTTAIKTLRVKMASATTAVGKLGAAMLATSIQTALLTAGITLIVAGIAGIVYASAKAKQKIKEQAEATYGLTEAQEEYGERLKEVAEYYSDLEASREDATKSVVNEYDNYEKLRDELTEIVDANGKIKDGYEDQADVLLGSLKEGLDFEYERTGDIIENYDEIIKKIDELIEKKKIEAIKLANQEAYGTAWASKGKLSTSRTTAQEAYERQEALLAQKEQEYEYKRHHEYISGTERTKYLSEIETLKNNLAELKKQWEDADEAYYNAMTIITNYEAFDAATLAGKDYTDELIALTYGLKHAETVSKKELYNQAMNFAASYKQIANAYANETNDAVKAQLADELTNTLLALEASLEECKKGGVKYAYALAEGFSVGVNDVETAFNNLGVSAKGAVDDNVNYLSAYTAVYNYISGMETGLIQGRKRVAGAAGQVADAVTDTVTGKWSINSPSKVAEHQTEMFGAGLVNGLRNSLRGVKEESRTLSEAVTGSTAQAFAAVADMTETDFGATVTITPVIDLSDVHRSAAAIDGLFGGTEHLTVNSKLYSGVTAERVQTESNGSDPLLAEIRSLREDLQDVSGKVGNMQMRIDGKTLIGWIAPEVDAHIGETVTQNNRGL